MWPLPLPGAWPPPMLRPSARPSGRSNPPAALQPGRWGEVSRDVRRVLEKFKQEKVTVGESAMAAAAGGAGRQRRGKGGG